MINAVAYGDVMKKYTGKLITNRKGFGFVECEDLD